MRRLLAALLAASCAAPAAAAAAGLACPKDALDAKGRVQAPLFSALPLSHTPFAARWAAAQEELRREFPTLRFEKPENLHVTLVYVGPGWDPAKADALEKYSLDAPDLSRGPVTLAGAPALFGFHKDVLALELKPVPAGWSKRLMSDRDAMTRQGLRPKDKFDEVFQPHVSLAYASEPEKDRPELQRLAKWLTERAGRFQGLSFMLDDSIRPDLLVVVGKDEATRFVPMRAYCASAACPDAAAGETEKDCPWAGTGRALQARAASGGDVSGLLSELAPGIDAQLKRDSQRKACLATWGDTINFDEFAKGVIVDPAILAALASRLGVPYADGPERRSHAAMEHAYGYLFSTLKTPFGFKRQRWVSGELERGLGLPDGVLSPAPSSGTLLGNLTYVAAHLALRDEPSELRAIEAETADVPAAIRSYDYAALPGLRLEETVGDVTIRTDLVALPHPGKDAYLLVYSVRDPSSKPAARLYTAFPVGADFPRSLGNPALLGDKPVVSRYNAFIPGVTGQTRLGVRKLLVLDKR